MNVVLNEFVKLINVVHSFESGYWDKGRKMIHTFLREHTCNRICKKMKLPEATKDLKVEIAGQATVAKTS